MKFLLITVMMALAARVTNAAAVNSCWSYCLPKNVDATWYCLQSNSTVCLDNALIPKDAKRLYYFEYGFGGDLLSGSLPEGLFKGLDNLTEM